MRCQSCLSVFFSCNTEAGAPGRRERICSDVVRARVTVVVVVCFIVVFGALFGAMFFFIFIQQFVPSQVTRVHDVCPTFAVD